MKKLKIKPESFEAVPISTFKNTKGITLIALIITIIVLIILAGVAINTLTGDNSIINNAIKAKEETLQKSDEEQLKIAVMSSYDMENGSTNILINELNNNIKQIDGFDENTAVTKLPAVVKIHDNEYEIDRNGNVIKLIPGEEKFPIYAVFYTDKNELVFQTSDTIDTSRGNVEEGTAILYNGIEALEASQASDVPWYSDSNYNLLQTVTFAQRIYPKSTAYWFSACTNLSNINNIENLKTKNVTNMRYMFNNCSRLTSLNVSNFNTINVTNMSSMFTNCSGLNNLDVSNFNTRNVTKMYQMFAGCSELTSLDVSNFDTSNATEQVLGMGKMFYGCSKLTSLDLRSFDTSNVTWMSGMFMNCRELKSIDLSGFDTKNVTNMTQMFYGCNNLTSIYVSNNWSVEKVTNSVWMFTDCTNLVGAIAYDSTKVDATYANYTNGYLTLKTD